MPRCGVGRERAEVADNEKTVTSTIDTDIPATQKIKELGDVSAQAAVKVDSLGDVIAEAESKAGQTAGMKAQAEAHKQVGVAAEEAAKRTRTATQAAQQQATEAAAQVSRMSEIYKKAFVPTRSDRDLGASLPAFKELTDLRRSLASIARDGTVSEDEFGRAAERAAARYEKGAEVMKRAGLTHMDLAKMTAESRTKLIEAAEAIDMESRALEKSSAQRQKFLAEVQQEISAREKAAVAARAQAEQAQQAFARGTGQDKAPRLLFGDRDQYVADVEAAIQARDAAATAAAGKSQANISKLLGIQEFYALSSEVEGDYTKFWQGIVDSQDRAAAQAGAQSRDNINKLLGVREFYKIAPEVEADYVSLWQRLGDAQDKAVAASAAEAQRDINALLGVKEFKDASLQQEIEYADHWARMLKQREGGGGNGNFGPSAEYLGQSRLASLSPDYAKDQRMNALSQERVATEKALADALASGAIPAAKAGEVQKQLAEHYTKAEEKAAKMNGTVHLSNNAYLQLTASARNTFDSLAAGLPISQVMITQGAQVVSALASEGSVMRALISPTGAATAAMITFVGVMALAVTRAASLASQLRDLQATALAYGNISVSAEDAAEAIKKIADNSKYSRSEATEAIKELTKMRVLSGESRAGIESVVASFGTATGKGISDATKELGSAFNGTYEGIKKLDEVYGFLDNSQLSVIRGMMKVGQTTEATRMAMSAFTEQMQEAGKVAEGAAAEGFQQMAKQWNAALDNMAASPGMKLVMQALTSVTNQTAGFMGSADARRADVENRLKIGEQSLRDSPDSMMAPIIERQVAELRAELQVMKNRESEGLRQFPDSLREGRFRRGETARAEADASSKLLTPLQEGLASARGTASAPAYLRAAEQARKDAMVNAPAGMTSADQRAAGEIAYQQALLQVTTALNDQMLATNRQVLAEKELAEASLLGARAMSEAKAAAAGREVAANGGNAIAARAAASAMDEYRALGALNIEINKLDEAQRLVNRAKEAGIEVATVEMRLAQSGLNGTSRESDARAKLTEIVRKEADEKARLNEIALDSQSQQAELLSAQNDNISASERAYRQAEIAAKAKYAEKPDDAALASDLALAAGNRDLANAGAGQSLRMQMNPDVVRDQQVANLKAMTGISPDDYAAQMEVIRRTHEDNTLARIDLENDFVSGAERSMRRYVQSVGSVADRTERVMTNAFKGMEDALTEFAMTGKFNFTDLANSIIQDMVRMQIQASITAPLMGALSSAGGLGGLFSSIFGSSNPYMDSGGIDTGGMESVDMGMDASGMGMDVSTTFAHGGAFANDNIVPFANGSAFANSIVDSPTLFKFAQGSKMGVMGEAGPEAIVPLTRGPNGDLGVQAFGGGGGAMVAEVPRISVEINNYGSSKDFEVEQDFSGLVPIVRIIARDEANKRVESFAQNEMPKSLRGEYKINRPPVARG